MRVSASGDGYNGVYTARKFTDGWRFVKNDGTLLTTGIGVVICNGRAEKIGTASPLARETPEELIEAIRTARPNVKIVEIKDDNS